MSWTRRDFLGRGLAGWIAAAAAPVPALAQSPSPPRARGACVLSSRGERWGRKVNAAAWKPLAAGGTSLDAVVAGANVVELDPEDQSVGYGGLPNEEGVVQLDASVMSGRHNKSGAVGALERIKTPSSVARLVLERTDHAMLVGEGALRFARAHGFEEANLLTGKSRLAWLKWKENLSPTDDWLPPEDGVYSDRGGRVTGTINVLAVDARGDLSGCTTTSGLSYEIPGRLGDSPIIGAGLYVDNEVGAAGATGRGEELIRTCGCFLMVEAMRRGLTPEQACRETLERIVRWSGPEPDFDVKLVALRRDGEAACVGLKGRAARPPEAALQNASGFRVLRGSYLYEVREPAAK